MINASLNIAADLQAKSGQMLDSSKLGYDKCVEEIEHRLALLREKLN